MIQEKEPAYFAEFRKDIKKEFSKIDERFDKIYKRFDGIDIQLKGVDIQLKGVDVKLKEIGETLETHFEAIGEVKTQITELSESRSTKAIKNLEKRTKVLEDLLLTA